MVIAIHSVPQHILGDPAHSARKHRGGNCQELPIVPEKNVPRARHQTSAVNSQMRIRTDDILTNQCHQERGGLDGDQGIVAHVEVLDIRGGDR